MNGNKRCAARAKREMFTAAGFSDWNPSHFLDVAEMTAALAIGFTIGSYDYLTPSERKTIRQAIIEKRIETRFGALQHEGFVDEGEK